MKIRGLSCMLSLALAALSGAPGVLADPGPEPQTKKSADASKSTDDKTAKKGSPVSAYYKKGLRIETEDNRFSARIRWRVQMRFTDLNSDDLVSIDDPIEKEAGFNIRRARFKLDGHAYAPWLKYYLEYGIAANVMLTWQFDIDRFEKLKFRVGQYKVVYNRERVDSSGQQQFVDRSIVNRPFTVDRQQGMHVTGRMFRDSPGDSQYWFGVFTGTGRGGGLDSDGRPMYVGRWQWNFLGRAVPFTQSDVKSTPKPIASLAVGGASDRGRFTRWSSSGGGQLLGFADGAPGQYRVRQWMGEFSLMHRGLSVQSEYHFKKIDDTVNNTVTDLDGVYAQVGYFFHESFEKFPKRLEFAARWARVDPGKGAAVIADREAAIASNYFFSGHDNKLTADVSYLRSGLPGGGNDDGWMFRLQWDITF